MKVFRSLLGTPGKSALALTAFAAYIYKIIYFLIHTREHVEPADLNTISNSRNFLY